VEIVIKVIVAMFAVSLIVCGVYLVLTAVWGD